MSAPFQSKCPHNVPTHPERRTILAKSLKSANLLHFMDVMGMQIILKLDMIVSNLAKFRGTRRKFDNINCAFCSTCN